MTNKARLDADRMAKPKTRITAGVVNGSDDPNATQARTCWVGQGDTYVAEDGTTIPLTKHTPEELLAAQVTSLQQRGNELLEEARAARRDLAMARVVNDAVSNVLFEKAEDERTHRALLKKAELFVRRVSLRTDNPPRWGEEARALADEMHEAIKDKE